MNGAVCKHPPASVSCNFDGIQTTIQGSASIEQIDTADNRKEKPTEISSKADGRKRQFETYLSRGSTGIVRL